MVSGRDPADGEEAGFNVIPQVSVPEIRDYQRINLEIVRLLNEGYRQIRLVGVEGQRLLVSGIQGDWEAIINVEGSAGPELAADLDAHGLTVVCSGSAADGAGRGMKAGGLLVMGDAGDAVGYAQSGGWILVQGDAGHRAGLDQSGGWLVLGGKVGRLAGHRQKAGRLVLLQGEAGPYFHWGKRGGLVARGIAQVDDLDSFQTLVSLCQPWISEETKTMIVRE